MKLILVHWYKSWYRAAAAISGQTERDQQKVLIGHLIGVSRLVA